MKELAPWLWIAAIAVIFWLLVIRPAAKRQKQIGALQASLAVGDDVVLTSGVFATVTALAEDHLEVEIAPGVVITVVRGAVASVRRDESGPAEPETITPTDDSQEQ